MYVMGVGCVCSGIRARFGVSALASHDREVYLDIGEERILIDFDNVVNDAT